MCIPEMLWVTRRFNFVWGWGNFSEKVASELDVVQD